MAFILNGTTCTFTSSSIRDQITEGVPLGVWRYKFDSMRGSYLERAEDFNSSYGNLYDNVPNIANHIVEAYTQNVNDNGNLGVLLAGKKGGGKSLISRVVIDNFKYNVPTIIIDNYDEHIPDFLNNIKNCIVFIDEFEKIFDGHSDELLSILDGISSDSNNLYLLTCNEIIRLDESLFSRPGRIRYFYKMEGISPETVKRFLSENIEINNLDILNFLIEKLSSFRWITIDILKCVVSEINAFCTNDSTLIEVEDLISNLNITLDSGHYFVTVYFTKKEVQEDGTTKVVEDFDSDNTYTKSNTINFDGYGWEGQISLKNAKFNGYNYDIPVKDLKVIYEDEDVKRQERTITKVTAIPRRNDI